MVWKFAHERDSWENHALLQLSTSTLVLPRGDSAVSRSGNSEEFISYEFRERPEGLKGAVEQLAFSEGLCGVFVSAGSSRATNAALELFYFEYEPGNPRFIHDVFGHGPEVCMSASGAVLEKRHETKEIRVGGKAIPVRVLEFSSPLSDSPLWIFKLTWLPEDAPFQPSRSATSLRREKVLAGLFQGSNPPARIVLAGARDFATREKAWAAFEALVVTKLYFSKGVTNTEAGEGI